MLLRQFHLFMSKAINFLFFCFIFSWIPFLLPSCVPESKYQQSITLVSSSHPSYPLCSNHKVLKESHHHFIRVCSSPPQTHCFNSVLWHQPGYSQVPLLCSPFSAMLVILNLSAKYLLEFRDLEQRLTL